ncbi:MAG: V-type ATP synthase subunit I [Candidatus Odinarchaeia archaeon]
MLKPVSMKKFTIIALDEHVDKILRTVGELGVAQLVNVGERVDQYEGLIEAAEPSDKYYRISSLLSRVEGLIGDLKISEDTVKKKIQVPAEPTEEFLDEVDKKLKEIESEYASYSEELEALKEKEARDPEEERQMQELVKKINALAEKYAAELVGLREALNIEREIEEAKTLSGKTQRSYIFEGWVKANDAEKLKTQILKVTGNKAVVVIHSVDAKKPNPPTLLKNPSGAKPCQILTEGYAIPSYREIDPTILMTITFPIMFGMMFGDIGHGLILLVAAVLGYVAKLKKMKFGGMIDWWIKASPLMITCAISSIFFGILFGEFLGYSIYSEPWYITIAQPFAPLRDALVALFRFYDFDEGIQILTNPAWPGYAELPPNGPIFFSPFHHPWLLFVLSVIIGSMHITAGLIMGVINNIREGKYKKAFFDRAVWIWFYLGLVWLVFNRGLTFTNWFATLSLLDPAFLVFILPIIVMIFGKFVVEGAMESIFGTFEVLVASISNTISYARILALNMVHAGFAKTFINLGAPGIYYGHAAAECGYIIVELTPGYFMNMFIGLFLIMSLESLLSFINTLRLHWVEWFLKFYKGEGYKFKPFKIERIYTIPT